MDNTGSSTAAQPLRHQRRSGKWRNSAHRNLWIRDGGTCRQCSAPDSMGDPLHVDHVVPLSQGGSNHMENLQLLCSWCHKKKTSWEKARYSQLRWQNSGLHVYAEILL